MEEVAMEAPMSEGKKPEYEVFISQKNGDKSYYTRIGAGWEVAKGGISIKLTALPIDGSLVLFPRKGE
jgi:hypothetical protein